jgi:Putative prokaryotic signal transducing protein
LRDEFSVVYSGNVVQADLLKCLLEGEGIGVRLEDEFIGMIAPYAASPGGAGAVKVLIAKSGLDRGRTIVENFVKGSKV